MGNEEDSYDDEYDSEGSYFSEIEFAEPGEIMQESKEMESYDEEYESEEDIKVEETPDLNLLDGFAQ